MKPETIKGIFTNLLFVIGVILMITGFIQGTRTVVKLAVFENYPLETWEETKCEQYPYVAAPVDSEKTTPAEVNPRVKEDCKAQLATERKVKMTEDIVASISFLVSGATLVYFFRRFILK